MLFLEQPPCTYPQKRTLTAHLRTVILIPDVFLIVNEVRY